MYRRGPPRKRLCDLPPLMPGDSVRCIQSSVRRRAKDHDVERRERGEELQITVFAQLMEFDFRRRASRSQSDSLNELADLSSGRFGCCDSGDGVPFAGRRGVDERA